MEVGSTGGVNRRGFSDRADGCGNRILRTGGNMNRDGFSIYLDWPWRAIDLR